MRVLISIVLLVALAGLATAADNFKIGRACQSADNATYAPGEIIVKFNPNVSRQAASAALSTLGTTLISRNESLGFSQLAIPAGKTVEEMVAAFSARPDVEYAEPNYIAHAFMTPNDPYFVYQWHFPLINVPAAWDQTNGAGVVVAVIDCGVAYETYGAYTQAPDLAGTTFVQGYDYVNNDSHPDDDCAHGTHVCGTIAQTTNNSLGVAGVAYGCSIMPVKVLDASGSGTYAAIANGITYAANNGAKVINMSLGGASGSTTLQNAIVYAYNAGVTIVCAAGNTGTSVAQYPASYTQCISVSAVRYDKTYTSYTSYGSNIDICAPGGDVTVDQNGDGYVDGVLQQTHDGTNYGTFGYYFYEGTSMACPHVAGVAAMVIAKAGGTLAPDSVRKVLQNTATDLGTTGWDQYYGYGLVNASAAVAAVSTTNPPVAAFSGTPTSGTYPLTVTFTDASTYTPTSWSWDFGDGSTSTVQNPSHIYTAAGTFTVALTATNAYGSNTLTKTGYITVTAPNTNPPVAAFSGTPTSGTIPLTVTFTDASTNTPTSWSWNFGDGSTSTVQNPSHIYTTAGTYSVALTATNAYGSNTLTKSSYITASAATQSCDDFADGSITDWLNKTGTWTATGGYMKGNSTTTNAKTTSPFGSFSTATINCSVRMNTGRSNRYARIIFGYTSASTYRYVQGDDAGNTWKIYEMTNGTSSQKASWSSSISSATWYAVTVKVFSTGVVSVAVGGTTLGSYTFSSVITGPVGVGYSNSNSDFDNFCVSSAVAASNDWVEMDNSGANVNLPDGFTLDQNYPNPFNPTTKLSYSLANSSHVSLEIYNVLGRQVTTLVNQNQAAGRYQVEWNSTDQSGSPVASGVYFYRLTVGNQTLSKKMLLIK
jgi:serine protease